MSKGFLKFITYFIVFSTSGETSELILLVLPLLGELLLSGVEGEGVEIGVETFDVVIGVGLGVVEVEEIGVGKFEEDIYIEVRRSKKLMLGKTVF